MKTLSDLREKLSTDPTVTKLSERYRGLSSREQLIVKGLAGLLFIVILLQITLVPLYQENQQLKIDLEKQLSLYNRMAENGYRFSFSSGLAATNRPLLSEVTRLSRQRGITLSRYEQDNAKLRVWFDNAAFDDAANLLQDLSRLGILTNQINIDRQEQAGRVNIRATLAR